MWLHFDHVPRVQGKQLVKDQQCYISVFVVHLTISSSNQEHQPRHDNSIPCKAVYQIYGDAEHVPSEIFEDFSLLRIYATHYRSGHRRCSVKKGVLRNFTKFTGKHLCQSLFFNTVADLRLLPLFYCIQILEKSYAIPNMFDTSIRYLNTQIQQNLKP